MFNFFGSTSSSDTNKLSSSSSPNNNQKLRTIQLLVIQSDDYDWKEFFEGKTLTDGSQINVLQTGWEHILVGPVDNYSKHRTVVTVRQVTTHGTKANANQAQIKTRPISFFPDFLLIRNEVFLPHVDHRNLLFGFMYADIPSVNTLTSIYSFCERPIIQGQLNRLNRELGPSVFPVIMQNYSASHREFMYTLEFPAVVKVGSAHAGFGKMRIRDHHDMEDFRSVLAVTGNSGNGKYCLAEPFIHGDYDLRIQKIGTHYRAFKRISVSGDWKTNTGSSHLEVVPLTDEFKIWVDQASKMFGGLDILTVDAIHSVKDGKHLILEVNGTSSGLAPEFAEEDNMHIRDLVLDRMNQIFCSN